MPPEADHDEQHRIHRVDRHQPQRQVHEMREHIAEEDRAADQPHPVVSAFVHRAVPSGRGLTIRSRRLVANGIMAASRTMP